MAAAGTRLSALPSCAHPLTRCRAGVELTPLNGTGPLYKPGTKLTVKLVPMGDDRPVGKHAASGVLYALDAAGNW